MKGLSNKEIEYRINNGLINNKIIKNSRTIKEILLSNIITLFNIINIILFILILTTGSITNGMFIITIFFNTVISVYQEIKAKKIVDNLKISTQSKVQVIRNGEKQTIFPNEILLDDLLYLKQGDTLCVDAKIIKSENLEVDESIITGESNSIIKVENDLLISGSIVVCGNAYAKVTSINMNTYANNLIKEASAVKDDTSYLMNNINSILKVVTFLLVPVGLLLFITQFFFSGQTYTESILSSVAGIIGMVPDGLVLLTSISLTVGVIKMADKKVIIQKLSGIESLACVDVLCLDKTGTITDGTMEVIDVLYLYKNKDKINNIIANMLNNDGNATNEALNKYFNINEKLNVIEKIPFSSSRKYSLIKFDNKIYALGAFSYLTNKSIDDFKSVYAYINKGYRIITLVECYGKFDINDNKIVCFIVLKDNIRKNAKETLEYFRKQNISIKIISGDDPLTVSNILKQLSIEGYDKYISGNELSKDPLKLEKDVNNFMIFGRVTPHQKQAIVKALRKCNSVGYIGDGVNDILALKESDCGIALASGISAARSVSEVVLTDPDFSILPNIVNEGRRVVNNIERVASMYLIKTVYSFLIALLCIILSHEYPFYPVQLTLIGVTCVGIPSFFLAIEPNYNKVKKGFLRKVFRNALPNGICVFFNILILIIFSYILKINFEDVRFIIVAITGYLNLRLLYTVSKPLSFNRKILLCLCSFIFYLSLVIFNDLFHVTNINIISLVVIGLLIFIDNYIIEFLISIYDNFIEKFSRNKRSRVVNEKI